MERKRRGENGGINVTWSGICKYNNRTRLNVHQFQLADARCKNKRVVFLFLRGVSLVEGP